MPIEQLYPPLFIFKNVRLKNDARTTYEKSAIELSYIGTHAQSSLRTRLWYDWLSKIVMLSFTKKILITGITSLSSSCWKVVYTVLLRNNLTARLRLGRASVAVRFRLGCCSISFRSCWLDFG